MSKYLIKGETLNAVADKIRDCLDETVGLQIRQSAIGEQAGSHGICEGLLFDETTGEVMVVYGYNFHILIPSEINGVAVTKISHQRYGNENSVQYITIPKSITFISGDAFTYCDLSCIFYLGTEEEWNKINKGGVIYDNVVFNSTLNRLQYDKDDDDYIYWTAVAAQYIDRIDTEGSDYDANVGDRGFANDWRFISYDYRANNEGVVVPVIYKTSSEGGCGIKALGEEDSPDILEPFFYVGTVVIDGSVYDKWRKIEFGLKTQETRIFTWDSDSRLYVYTNRVVVGGRIRPEDFPEKISEVYGAGYKAGYAEAQSHYSNNN